MFTFFAPFSHRVCWFYVCLCLFCSGRSNCMSAKYYYSKIDGIKNATIFARRAALIVPFMFFLITLWIAHEMAINWAILYYRRISASADGMHFYYFVRYVIKVKVSTNVNNPVCNTNCRWHQTHKEFISLVFPRVLFCNKFFFQRQTKTSPLSVSVGNRFWVRWLGQFNI